MTDGKLPNESGSRGPLAIPFKVPRTVIGFDEIRYCARLYGFSVRYCECMIPGGGFKECPPAARGLLEPIAEFRARVHAADPTLFAPPAQQTARALIGNSGFARSALATVKQGIIGSATVIRPDPTDVERPPETREQIASAVAAERASLPRMPGGKAAGFTGNICGNCQSTRMVRNGVCETCLDCYHSGECG